MAEIAFVIPTRNEMTSMPRLVAEMECVLADEQRPSCVLIVDDSDDATPEVVAGLARQRPWLQLLHRTHAHRTGGLAGAVLAGFAQVDADVLVVMDGDLQHPPRVALELARLVADGGCDLAIGSRYIDGGSSSGLGGPYRRFVSRAANLAARRRLPRVAAVTDPMSGCFALHRRVLDHSEIQADGFKILLEILARGAWTTVQEVPLAFGTRDDGDSKANASQGLRYLRQLNRLRRELEARPRVIDLREPAEAPR